jgi:hypothetical protein
MRVRLSIVSKLTALVVGAVVLTALAVNEFYLRASDRILIERAIIDLQKEAEFFQYPLTGKVGQLRDDVKLLTNLPVMRAIVRATANGGEDPETQIQMNRLHDSLAATFTEMLRTRSYYRQIRFIGIEQGKEVVRVEHFGSRIERTPDSQLQDRSDATYFVEPLLLAPGDVYLSEADLNREHGNVSFPCCALPFPFSPLTTSRWRSSSSTSISAKCWAKFASSSLQATPSMSSAPPAITS